MHLTKLFLSLLMISFGAVLKGPLFSLGASGQLAKALVYFPWKGLNVVREYVIPANPQTDPQTTQRDYLKDAVAMIHALQAHATRALNATDVSAWALWAGVIQSATTWFNQMVRNYVDQMIAGDAWVGISAVVLAPGIDKVNIQCGCVLGTGGAPPTNMTVRWGTSKTALFNSDTATPALLGGAGKDIAGLTTGVKYFFQLEGLAAAEYIGCKSGIYYAKPL